MENSLWQNAKYFVTHLFSKYFWALAVHWALCELLGYTGVDRTETSDWPYRQSINKYISVLTRALKAKTGCWRKTKRGSNTMSGDRGRSLKSEERKEANHWLVGQELQAEETACSEYPSTNHIETERVFGLLLKYLSYLRRTKCNPPLNRYHTHTKTKSIINTTINHIFRKQEWKSWHIRVLAKHLWEQYHCIVCIPRQQVFKESENSSGALPGVRIKWCR